MITIFTDNCNPISQNLYDNIINDLQFHQLSCDCGHFSCLTIHGYYKRSIKSEDSFLRLRICRLKCSFCNKTHALLLSSIVPYSQVSFSDHISIISSHERLEGFDSFMDSHSSIDENNIRYILRQYHLHWFHRLLSISLILSTSFSFIQGCFSNYSRQFMQIKRTPNILFLKPT